MSLLIEILLCVCIVAVVLAALRQILLFYARRLITMAISARQKGFLEQARRNLILQRQLLWWLPVRQETIVVQAEVLLNWFCIEEKRFEQALAALLQLESKLVSKRTNPRDLISVCIPIAWLYFLRDDLPRSKQWLDKGINAHECNGIKANIDYASLLTVQAAVLLKVGDLVASNELLERSLSILARETGNNSLYCAPIMTYLGWLELLKGNYTAGQCWWQRGFSIYCAHLGENDRRSQRLRTLLSQFSCSGSNKLELTATNFH